MALWATVVALGLGIGIWIRGQHEARELTEGKRLAARVSELVYTAREAERDGEFGEAERLLEDASRVLERVGIGPRGAPYATILAERAALILKSGSDGAGTRGRVRDLLTAAWGVENTGNRLRARIARDRAALATLDGDLEAARDWYTRAADLVPGGDEVRERLEALGVQSPKEGSSEQ